jgi:hypothetical protein
MERLMKILENVFVAAGIIVINHVCFAEASYHTKKVQTLHKDKL